MDLVQNVHAHLRVDLQTAAIDGGRLHLIRALVNEANHKQGERPSRLLHRRLLEQLESLSERPGLVNSAAASGGLAHQRKGLAEKLLPG